LAVRLEVPENGHAGDGLILALAVAFAADRVRPVIRFQDFGDLAAQRAVSGLLDFDDGLGLAGFVVDGLPAAGRRFGGKGQ